MTKPKRRLGRPLLLAAATAATLVIPGCNDLIGGSGNLMAPNCDMYPTACSEPVDAAVPDLEGAHPDLKQPADLATED